MAKAEITLPDEFLSKLSRLGSRTNEVMDKVLTAGAAVVMPKVKTNLQSAIGTGTKIADRSTGELVASVGVSPVKVDGKGRSNLKIGFNEPRSKQYPAKKKRSYDVITNAMIANVIEHGKSGQPAKPFMKPTLASTKAAAEAAMAEALEREVDAL